MNMFRTLRADEIDCRISQVKKDGSGLSLLLYKDARCDQNILDEIVGPFNWQRVHTRDNRNCIVSIKNPETGEWISKEDTGTESNTESEKGLASDSFKRACFNEAVKAEADKLTARRKALENRAARLKEWLAKALDGEKLKTARCSVYQTHGTRLAVEDEPKLIEFLQSLDDPEKFLRFRDPELKRDEIKKALKDDFMIPGATLESTESVVIK